MSDSQATTPASAWHLLEATTTALARFPAKGADKPAAAAAAESVVAQYREMPGPSAELTYAVIKLLRAAARNEEALVLLRERRPQVKGASRYLLFYETELCLLTGRTGEGLQLMRRLKAQGPLPPSWDRALARTVRDHPELQAALAQALEGAPARSGPARGSPLRRLLAWTRRQPAAAILMLRWRLQWRRGTEPDYYASDAFLHPLASPLAGAAPPAPLEALERGLAQLRLGVDVEAQLSLVRPVLPGHNQALEALLFIEDRLRALRERVPQARADLGVFAKYHRARLIFVCGFGDACACVVAGFLAQHKAIRQPFGAAQMAHIQGRNGRAGIHPFLVPGTFAPQRMREQLATFLVESIVSLGAPARGFLAPGTSGDYGRIHALGELVDDFQGAMLCADALREVAVRRQVLARFVERLFSLSGGEHVVLGDVFLAPRAVLLGDLEDALFIVVDRDARDQFAGRLVQPGAADAELRTFQAMLRQGRSGFGRLRARLTPDQRQRQLWVARYEDLVLDAERRGALLERAGLARDGIVPDPRMFDLAQARASIGVHVHRLDATQRKAIERTLGIHMHEVEPQ